MTVLLLLGSCGAGPEPALILGTDAGEGFSRLEHGEELAAFRDGTMWFSHVRTGLEVRDLDCERILVELGLRLTPGEEPAGRLDAALYRFRQDDLGCAALPLWLPLYADDPAYLDGRSALLVGRVEDAFGVAAEASVLVRLRYVSAD